MSNISRSKCNQIMEFGQLTEYNMRNIFLEKPYTICGGETSPTSFSKGCGASFWGLSKYIETKLQTTCFYLILSFFKKQKEVWNQPPSFVFCIIFQEKYFYCYIILFDQVLLSDCLYFASYWPICLLQLFVSQVATSQILKLTLSF